MIETPSAEARPAGHAGARPHDFKGHLVPVGPLAGRRDLPLLARAGMNVHVCWFAGCVFSPRGPVKASHGEGFRCSLCRDI